jgi:type IX secretion system PorP/SprF family membrane protein
MTELYPEKRFGNKNQLAKIYYFSPLEPHLGVLLMRLIINCFIYLSLVMLSSVALAQQAPIFTQHTHTHMYSNPGFAGMGEGICISGLTRQQWVGFKDGEGNRVAPETFLITIDSPVRILKGGLGGAIIQDKLGFESNIGVQLGYAYHLDIGGSTLGIGTAVNFLNRTVDFSKFKPTQPNDPILATSEESDMLFDLNLGLFWHTPEFYYLGISVTSLLESKGKALTSASESGSFVGDRTIHLVAGYQYVFRNNPNYEFHPAVNVLSNLSTTQFNVSGTILYNNKFWGGVNYRFLESIGLMVGVLWNDFRIGYAYDVNTLGLNVPGSHEISLGYCFKISPDRSVRSYRNTRYL